MRPALLVSLLLVGCHDLGRFPLPGEGPPIGADRAATPDLPGPLADRRTILEGGRDDRRSDRRRLDLVIPDRVVPPDQSAAPKPVSVSGLIAGWSALKVPCIGDDGKAAGPDIGILDTPAASFVQGSVTLAGAPAQTISWVGGKNSVTVIWDPRSCGDENPLASDEEWTVAGLLVRGATLDSQGRLVLASTTGVKDVDFLDVSVKGAFEGSTDFAQADDSALGDTPQLVPTINAAKQGIIAASK